MRLLTAARGRPFSLPLLRPSMLGKKLLNPSFHSALMRCTNAA